MSNIQTYYHFKLYFQKVDQHTGGKWLIHSPFLNLANSFSSCILFSPFLNLANKFSSCILFSTFLNRKSQDYVYIKWDYEVQCRK